MKLGLRILLAVLALVVIGVVVALLFIDSIAARAIEKSGTYALGVPTEVDSADIGLFSGEYGLDGLRVANPPGFARPDFLTLGRARLEVSLASLASDRVTVPLIALEEISLDLERTKQGTNYGAILENLERFESGEAPEPEGEAGPKTFLIERIVLRQVRADVDLIPIGGEATRVALTIPEIVVEDLDSDGMTAAEICALVVKTLLQAAIEAGGGILPEDLLRDLRGRLDELEAVASEKVVEEVTGALEDVGKQLGGKAEEALDKAGKKLEDVFKKP